MGPAYRSCSLCKYGMARCIDMGLTSIGDLTGDSVVLMVVADVCVCVCGGAVVGRLSCQPGRALA